LFSSSLAALASTSLAPVDEVEEDEEVVERFARFRRRGKRVPASAPSNALGCEELMARVVDSVNVEKERREKVSAELMNSSYTLPHLRIAQEASCTAD